MSESDKKQPTGICIWCAKPLDNHCFMHTENGAPLCPDRYGHTRCQKTGPASSLETST
jgi:hypothetical protein